MVTNINELVHICKDELISREYREQHLQQIIHVWNEIIQWMQKNELEVFIEAVGYRYANEAIGTHICKSSLTQKEKLILRATRMLTSYQKDGDFEFRSPSVEYIYQGEIGLVAENYLLFLRDMQCLSAKTLEGKNIYLHDLSQYSYMKNIKFQDLSVNEIEAFFSTMGYTLASRHNAGSCLRNFFHYIYDQGFTENDCSIFILLDAYKRNCKIPTTYKEDEIKKVILSVERSSSIGKRDYLILLLAAEYGWRAGDICTFCFEDINWDKNVIRFHQQKTDTLVDYPLLASVGNAVIDYLKSGRPKSDAHEVILSENNETYGKPISSPTIHSIVSKYMRQANIRNWKEKKHGPHSLRHSLATNMLAKNVSLPIISSVLGHQTTATTKVYLKVDVNKLSDCALPMPVINSPHYKNQGVSDHE